MTLKESIAQWWKSRRDIVWPLLLFHAVAYAFLAGLLLGVILMTWKPA